MRVWCGLMPEIRRRLIGIALPALMTVVCSTAAAAAPAFDEDPQGARVIVKYKAQGTLMRSQAAAATTLQGPLLAARLMQRHGLALRDGRVVDRHSQVVHGDRQLSSAALAARLAADPEVEYAVPDLRRQALAVVPNDPLYPANAGISPAAGQWYLRAPDSTLVSAINAEAAWNLSTGVASIVVADIDTGVRFDHPDLAGKLLPGRDFILNGSDASDPGTWASAGECGAGSAARSSSWHGTQTSGLIGAQTGNGLGMASVGYNVSVLPVRVLGKCGGYDSDVIAGMLWAGGVSAIPTTNTHPARVLNLSLGSAGACHAAYIDAMNRLTAAGVAVVASAGNNEGLAVGAPANCPGAIAVAGVRHAGTKVGFSSLGPEVAIAAPGGNCVNVSGSCLYPILTTTNSGTTSPALNTYSDAVNRSVGTSFAAPLVAGTAGLMLSVHPSLTPAQIKTQLMLSARPFPATSSDPALQQCRAPDGLAQGECLCTTSTCGAGMLDTAAAVSAALGAAGGAVPTPAIAAFSERIAAGATLTLDGSASKAPPGRSITSHRWAITSGASVALIDGSAGDSSVRLRSFAPGGLSLRLTVTDSAGAQASSSATLLVTPGDFDRVANWAETAYANFFPKPAVAGYIAPYTYRYYAASGTYLGSTGGRAIVHNGRDWILLDVGALNDFLVQAAAAGF